jgi:ribosomal protein S6--L-glutamate ligase
MSALRIGFLLKRPYSAHSTSQFPLVVQALVDAGVVVHIIAAKGRLVDLSTVRVEHDLYVLKQISGLAASLAGALHAQGAALVNPYPVTVALRDKVIATRILQAAGVPTPATYVAMHPELLAPLLDQGPLVVKPYDGSGGHGVRVVRNEAELAAAAVQVGRNPILAQRYHPPQGHDLKIYMIGERLFGVRKRFPRRTEEEKHGEPFTPTAEQCDIALRCGRAFGIDLCGVDIIESEGKPYVVDMQSIPGFKGVPDAPSYLASYFYAAAERAAAGKPLFEHALGKDASAKA